MSAGDGGDGRGRGGRDHRAARERLSPIARGGLVFGLGLAGVLALALASGIGVFAG
ncbi:hypothetical protein [Salinilacihabitans rarus]|uniref:hypothetical protein n=1 Tax=Salinilacihabitans rarus TaxID=2961596 RepID=UPI0020C8B4C5|nr:hypothetical protein [Salinilacihabitans rarus]